MNFPYLIFFDKYPYAKDYDMLVDRIKGCNIFNNYLLFEEKETYHICKGCECIWVCRQLLK